MYDRVQPSWMVIAISVHPHSVWRSNLFAKYVFWALLFAKLGQNVALDESLGLAKSCISNWFEIQDFEISVSRPKILMKKDNIYLTEAVEKIWECHPHLAVQHPWCRPLPNHTQFHFKYAKIVSFTGPGTSTRQSLRLSTPSSFIFAFQKASSINTVASFTS